jgi:hypothetical protein
MEIQRYENSRSPSRSSGVNKPLLAALIQDSTEVAPPAWYAKRRVGRVAGKGLLLVSATHVCLVFYFYTSFRGRPRTIRWWVRSCGSAALIKGAVGLCLLKKPYWKDPHYRAERGREAAEIIRRENQGLQVILSQFPLHIYHRALTCALLNDLLKRDIETLSYSALIAKHTADLLPILNPTHQESVKRLLFAEAKRQKMGRQQLFDRYGTQLGELQAREEEINDLCRDKEASTLSFAEFRALHSESIESFSEEIKATLRTSFLQMPYRKMTAYPTERVHLGITGADICQKLIESAEQLTYERFRDHHGIEALQDYLSALEERLRQSFLELPYRTIKSAQLQVDWSLLDRGDLTEQVKKAVNSYLASHPYLPDGCNKHREAVVDGILTEENVDRVKRELECHLVKGSYAEILRFKGEMAIVGLGKPWVVSCLCADLDDFARFEWKHGLSPVTEGLIEGHNLVRLREAYISYIDGDYSRLASRDAAWAVLGMDAHSQPLKDNIRHRLNGMRTLEAFAQQFPRQVFTLKLLEPSHPKLVNLFVLYFSEGSYWKRQVMSCLQFAVPQHITSAINDAQQEEAKSTQTLERQQENARRRRQSAIQSAADFANERIIKDKQPLVMAQTIFDRALEKERLAISEEKRLQQQLTTIGARSRQERQRFDELRTESEKARINVTKVSAREQSVASLEGELRTLQGKEVTGYAEATQVLAREESLRKSLEQQRAELLEWKKLPRRLEELPTLIRASDLRMRQIEQEEAEERVRLNSAVAAAERLIEVAPCEVTKAQQELDTTKSRVDRLLQTHSQRREEALREAEAAFVQEQRMIDRDHRARYDATLRTFLAAIGTPP